MTAARELAAANTCPAAGLTTRRARDQRAALGAAAALPVPARKQALHESVDAEGDSFDREVPPRSGPTLRSIRVFSLHWKRRRVALATARGYGVVFFFFFRK